MFKEKKEVMKKKTYLAPAIAIKEAELHTTLLTSASITQIGGDSGLDFGTGEIPIEADSRRRRRNWEDEEDEEYDW